MVRLKTLDISLLFGVFRRLLKKHVKEVFLLKKLMDFVSIVADKGTNPSVADWS